MVTVPVIYLRKYNHREDFYANINDNEGREKANREKQFMGSYFVNYDTILGMCTDINKQLYADGLYTGQRELVQRFLNNYTI